MHVPSGPARPPPCSSSSGAATAFRASDRCVRASIRREAPAAPRLRSPRPPRSPRDRRAACRCRWRGGRRAARWRRPAEPPRRRPQPLRRSRPSQSPPSAPAEYIAPVPTPQHAAAVLDEVRERLGSAGVEYCMATYSDGHGIAKCKTVPIDHFDAMMHGSELFTAAALAMLGEPPADDELAVWPDPDAIVQLPWRPKVAFAPGNLYLRGEPYPMCPRTVLTRQAERARERGFVFNLGMETEFFFVRK